MGQSKTIASVIPYINNNYFLPSIQREFEWDEEQICKLFDSIMKGYPIKSFLLWRVDEGSDKIKYEFITDYVEKANYPKDSLGDKVKHHNKRVNDDFGTIDGNVTLVLDGQQRLSSLYMGLMGSYTTKEYGKYGNPDNYHRKKLYINLLSLKEDSDMKYDFKFLKPQPKNTKKKYWYEVGNILDVNDKYKEKDRVRKEIREDICEIKDLSTAEEIIDRLYDGIHNKEYINFEEVYEKDEEKVLEIFLRANKAGTKLSNEDLLLSIASSVWKNKQDCIKDDKRIIAGEKIKRYSDKLNKRDDVSSSDIDTRVILQCLSSCANLPVSLRKDDYKDNDKRLIKMKEVWQDDDFKNSITKTLDLINSFGLTSSYINIKTIIPIVTFLYRNDPTLSWKLDEGMKNRKNILEFICSSNFHSIYNSKTTAVLNKLSKYFKEENMKIFDLESIEEKLNSLDKTIHIDIDKIEVDKLHKNKRSKEKTRNSLYLLYEVQPANPNKNYHIDHIFPQDKLKKDKLIEKGINEQKAEKINNNKGRLGNLRVIGGSLNKKKSDKSPKKWLKKENNLKYEPDNINKLTDYENYLEFIQEREKLMLDELSKKKF